MLLPLSTRPAIFPYTLRYAVNTLFAFAQYETIDRGAVAAYLLCQAHQHALAAQRRRDPIYSNECYS